MVRKMAGEKRNDREWRIKRDKDTQTHTAVGQTLREPQDLARVLPGSWDLASAPPPASSEQAGRVGTFCTPAPGRHSLWEQSEGVKRA